MLQATDHMVLDPEQAHDCNATSSFLNVFPSHDIGVISFLDKTTSLLEKATKAAPSEEKEQCALLATRAAFQTRIQERKDRELREAAEREENRRKRPR